MTFTYDGVEYIDADTTKMYDGTITTIVEPAPTKLLLNALWDEVEIEYEGETYDEVKGVVVRGKRDGNQLTRRMELTIQQTDG